VAHLVSCLALIVTGCSPRAPSPAAPNDAGPAEAAPPRDAGTAPPEDAGADAAPAAGDCAAYCTAVERNCTKLGDGYANSDSCMANCKALPLGTVGDTLDTVGCRQAHALAAESAPFAECPLAGPFPPSGCGDPCDAFCKLAVTACGDSWQGHCTDACAKWPGNEAGAWDSTGNTLSCRQTNVERALENDGDLDDGGGGCGSVGTDSAECK
jgi:hypothetical protein